jgi:hypothetical protein
MGSHLQLGMDVDNLIKFSINSSDAPAVEAVTVDLAATVGPITAI